MIDRSAIEKIQELIMTADEGMATLGVIALPNGTTIHDLDQFRVRPRRHRRHFVTDSVEDFAIYVNNNHAADALADSPTLVFVGERYVKAIIGASTDDKPRFEDHVAELTIRNTPIYEAILGLAGKNLLNQRELADWMTEWADFIDCGIDAENGDVPVGQAIAAIRRMTVDVRMDSEHSTEEYQASRSAMELVEVNDVLGKIIGFNLTQPLFLGFDPVTITVRLTVFPDRDKGPRFMARILRHNDMILEQRNLVSKRIKGLMHDGIGFYVGETRSS